MRRRDIDAFLGRFTVGFVGIGQDKAVSMGSGTLARYGKVAGIIACAHVLETLKGDIGVVCFPTRLSEVRDSRWICR